MLEDVLTGTIAEYFSGGWRVAPFHKTPDGYIGVKAWPKRAARDANELQQLLNELAEKSNREPILGIVPPEGRYVVDIDTKKNTSALQLWKDRVIEAMGHYVEPELVVKTKSGGYHLYYADGSDRQLHSPTSIFSSDSGIDIRGYTGMVVAPTSIGTAADWQPGEYTIIRGRPTDKLVVLPLSKIIGDTFDEVDIFLKTILSQVNEALRNPNIPETRKHYALPDSLIIPASNRDNTLYRCAKLCRMAGLSQESAIRFMQHLGTRCEASLEEPTEHWVKLATDKAVRVYGNDVEAKFQSVSQFYEEFDNAGTVMLTGVAKSYYFFRLGSHVLRIAPGSKYSVENISNVLQGHVISSDDGPVSVKKTLPAYKPKDIAYSDAMYPRQEMPFFDFEGRRYVNTYADPFAGFEPDESMLRQAEAYVERFHHLVRHITGHRDTDETHLLDKLAWIVQKPYRKLPTGTIIYSRTRGSGKDVFMSLIREIVGRRYYMPITLQSIEDTHTPMHDKIICTASEVQLQTNARGNIAAASFMGLLKDKITQQKTYVNEKFVQPYSAPWFVNFFVLSNFELSTLIEPQDRRWDVFHATEEKLDQAMFGELADVGNDGVWIERDAAQNLFRKHIIYALRLSLKNRAVDAHFDRREALDNAVKQAMLEQHNHPAIEWMMQNLPPHFTEDVLMMACHFCPHHIRPEYVLRSMKEHLGPQIATLSRPGQGYAFKLGNAPVYEIVSDGVGRMPKLRFEGSTAKRNVFFITNKPRAAGINESQMRLEMKQWYLEKLNTYYAKGGDPSKLPGAMPS